MPPPARLFAPDEVEITDCASWFNHAPPERGIAQWKDGYSAKEQAKAWTRPGRPEIPEELWAAISGLTGEVDEIYGRPEHRTKLDDYSKRRQHDIFACARRHRATVAVIGVEAKACETFGGIVGDCAKAGPPSKRRARCNLLARALFGSDVMEEETDRILDADLSKHRYQLWTATVGTIIEAQKRGVDQAIVVVHQFRPSDLTLPCPASDKRQWKPALEANTLAFGKFAADPAAAGSRSHATEFVKPGTSIHLVKVESILDA
jgi:hypothetical protein